MSDSPRDANLGTAIHLHSHEESVTPVPEQRRARASWKDNQQQVLPENRLWIVFSGLMCCIFLAALDQVHFPSIIPTSPTYPSFYSMQTDHRGYCFTDHRRAHRRREKLQLGRQVRHLFPFMDHFIPVHLLPVPTSLQLVLSRLCTENYLTSSGENLFSTLLSCYSWCVPKWMVYAPSLTIS